MVEHLRIARRSGGMSGLAGRGREGLRLLKATCKKVWEVVAVGRRRHPSVYSASIPRIVPVLIMQKSSEATEFSLQTFIIVCPGRGTEARRHTSTHSSRHTQALNHERSNGLGEGLSVSVCTGRGHSRGHGRCQGGRGTIIAAPHYRLCSSPVCVVSALRCRSGAPGFVFVSCP